MELWAERQAKRENKWNEFMNGICWILFASAQQATPQEILWISLCVDFIFNFINSLTFIILFHSCCLRRPNFLFCFELWNGMIMKWKNSMKKEVRERAAVWNGLLSFSFSLYWKEKQSINQINWWNWLIGFASFLLFFNCVGYERRAPSPQKDNSIDFIFFNQFHFFLWFIFENERKRKEEEQLN